MGLGSPEKTFAEEAAGTDGNLGLKQIVPGAQRVCSRVQEDHNPLFLISLQKEPEDRQGSQAHA